MKATGLGLALLLGAAVPVAATDLSFQVTNNTDLTIMEIYASPPGTVGVAGAEDLLRAGVLARREVSLVLIPDGSSRCDYDLRLIFENGRELVLGTNVCEDTKFEVRRAP